MGGRSRVWGRGRGSLRQPLGTDTAQHEPVCQCRGAAKESATEAAPKGLCCLKRQNWLTRMRDAGSPNVASPPHLIDKHFLQAVELLNCPYWRECTEYLLCQRIVIQSSPGLPEALSISFLLHKEKTNNELSTTLSNSHFPSEAIFTFWNFFITHHLLHSTSLVLALPWQSTVDKQDSKSNEKFKSQRCCSWSYPQKTCPSSGCTQPGVRSSTTVEHSPPGVKSFQQFALQSTEVCSKTWYHIWSHHLLYTPTIMALGIPTHPHSYTEHQPCKNKSEGTVFNSLFTGK